jgi:hypothetical protein
LSGAASASVAVDGEPFAMVRRLPQRFLNFVLFVTVLLSSIAFVEPSPHDVLMMALLVVSIGARVRFDRKLVPLVMLLAVWLVGGSFSLIRVSDQQQNLQYAATSFYLALAAIMFAALFCDGDLARLSIVRRGYLVAALIATAAGYIGFFHLLPHSDIFLDHDRVSATFKDPNVYAPFLIFPLLLLMIELMTRGVRPLAISISIFLLGGLFLSFSRGAWGHFVISAVTVVLLLIFASPDPRMRGRVMLFSIGAVIAVALLFVLAISIPSVHDLFLERAKTIQPYDVGPGGRFWEQKLALSVILDHPNGLGPFEFSRLFGTQQHDVYMQGFLVYGWLGGIAYLTFVLVTLAIGFCFIARARDRRDARHNQLKNDKVV